MRVFTVVLMYQGYIDGVISTLDEQESEILFEQYTGVSWNDFNSNTDILSGTNVDGTNIFVNEVRV